MRYGRLGSNGTAVEPVMREDTAPPTAVREIPYDYVATFRLAGVAGRRVQDVITVSTEGTFVAVAIGYSFIPARNQVELGITLAGSPPVFVIDPPSPFTTPPQFNGIPISLLQALQPGEFNGSPSNAELLARTMIVARLRNACGIDFKYSLVDSGSGRELQNQPIHNIAGLGSADGDRPFRPFARPAYFAPRSTIRIEVEEVSEGSLFRDAQLFIVLQGYKRLGE
jgi:hypothetical protein